MKSRSLFPYPIKPDQRCTAEADNESEPLQNHRRHEPVEKVWARCDGFEDEVANDLSD
jgi:hypothetical protein